MNSKEGANRIATLAAQVASNEAQLAALRDLNNANSHRLTQLNRELTSRDDKQEVRSVLVERLDQTFDDVSDLTEQLLERSNRLLEVEAEIKVARKQIASLESQLSHQVQRRKGLESRIKDLEGKRKEALEHDNRVKESVSTALDLLSARSDERDAGVGQPDTDVDERVIEILVAALGES